MGAFPLGYLRVSQNSRIASYQRFLHEILRRKTLPKRDQQVEFEKDIEVNEWAHMKFARLESTQPKLARDMTCVKACVSLLFAFNLTN